MSNIQTGSVDASTLSQDDLLALVNKLQSEKTALEVEKARIDALDGVTIQYKTGTNKKTGNTWRNLSVSGGVFGGMGINLKPKKWEKLKQLTAQIDEKMQENLHLFDIDE